MTVTITSDLAKRLSKFDICCRLFISSIIFQPPPTPSSSVDLLCVLGISKWTFNALIHLFGLVWPCSFKQSCSIWQLQKSGAEWSHSLCLQEIDRNAAICNCTHVTLPTVFQSLSDLAQRFQSLSFAIRSDPAKRLSELDV